MHDMKDYFGDPHAESWAILGSNYFGMQARCNKSWEKVNPIGSNSNWFIFLPGRISEIFLRYNIVVRSTKAAFLKDISKNVSWQKTSAMCNDSKDPFIAQLEEE